MLARPDICGKNGGNINRWIWVSVIALDLWASTVSRAQYATTGPAIFNRDRQLAVLREGVEPICANETDRMLAVMVWMRGKAPHFFLEAHGSPLILGGSESWTTSNGVQCEPDKWGMKSWLTPAGQLQKYCDIPGLQAAYVETTPTYPNEVGVTRSTRTFINCAAGLVISERFASSSTAPVVWQAAVSVKTSLEGSVATIRGINNITLRAVTVEGSWTLRPTPERTPRFELIEPLEMAMLELQSPAGNGAFDVLLDWHGLPAKLHRQRSDLLLVTGDGQPIQILLPGKSQSRTIGTFQTDAEMALLQSNGQLSLAAVRSTIEGSIERVWASLPVDVTIQSDAYWISGLKYGEFATLRGPNHFICVRVGNGIEVWGRSPTPLRLHVRHRAIALQLNGRPAELMNQDGWVSIDIPDTTALGPPARDSLAKAIKSGSTPELIQALHDIQQAMAWECADDVRKLMKWDASREEILPAHVPLKTEATYVRLEAAAAASYLGDRAAIPNLIALLLDEAHRNYAPPTKPIGDAKWWGFPSRSVAIESLMLLHATETLKVLDEVLDLEVWPHGIDAVARARVVLA